MKHLTQRALRVFSVLEDFRVGSIDLLDGLLPFFEPILFELNGQYFDPQEFTDRVKTAYRWNFTADVAEEFIPRFENQGWLTKTETNGDNAAFKVTYDNSLAASLSKKDTEIGTTIDAISQEFKAFVDQISPLTSYSKTPAQLTEILIEWLISIDAYNEEVLQEETSKVTRRGGTIAIENEIPDGSQLSSEDRYIAARFVKDLFKNQSQYVPALCRITSIGLLTEVVQDFCKPTNEIDNTDLVVHLDGPVAMDLLGVSGKSASENIRPLLEEARNLGASVRVFDITLQEISVALNAVLARPAPQRTGPTAGAIRRREATEPYVREVARDPGSILSKFGVQTTQRKLDQFPNEHPYFLEDLIDDVLSRINWHQELAPREHDATIFGLVMRMRKGTRKPDLFKSKHLIISRNAMLSQLARRFCLENDLISSTEIPPVIHQRLFATAMWLRTGMGVKSDEIPKRHVLAACERVLELKKGVVDQVRLLGKNLTADQAEQLDILLTQDRSVQLLQDKTLNHSNVVTSENIGALVEAMKNELAADIHKDADRKIRSAQKSARKRVKTATKESESARAELAEIRASLSERDSEDLDTVEAAVEAANSGIPGTRIFLYSVSYLLLLLFAVSPFLLEVLEGSIRFVPLGISGLFGAWLGYLQIQGHGNVIEAFVAKRANRRLEKIVQRRQIDSKIQRFDITWNDNSRIIQIALSKRLSMERTEPDLLTATEPD